jgi:hypothetical protein
MSGNVQQWIIAVKLDPCLMITSTPMGKVTMHTTTITSMDMEG